MDSVYSYREMFPGESTQSEASVQRHSESLSEAMAGRVFSDTHLESLSQSHLDLYRTPEGRLLIESARVKNTGYSPSPDTRRRLSDGQVLRWADPTNRKQMSETMKESNGSPYMREHFRRTSLEVWARDPNRRVSLANEMRKRWSDPEYKEFVSFLISVAKTEQWTDPKFQQKMFDAWHKTPTGPELSVESILATAFPGRFILNSRLGTSQVVIGSKIPDFLGTNGKRELIEVFGTYWHDPELFPWRLNESELVNYYSDFGYTCLVIWEDEVEFNNVARRVNEIFPR
jgi:hypothetical protein